MDWLDKTLASGVEILVGSGSWMLLYLFFGFIFAKVCWYIDLRIIYKRAVEAHQRKFLKSKNIDSAVIPENLKLEWGEYFNAVKLIKPKPGTLFITFFWPAFIAILAFYYLIIWPVIKFVQGLAKLNAWIEGKALQGLDEQLPTEKDREKYQEQTGKDELKKLQSGCGEPAKKTDSSNKTIGPKKT